MSKWRDFRQAMAAELLLLAYAITWGVALLVTVVLTK